MWVPLAKNSNTPGHLLEKLSHQSTYQENELELITYVVENLLAYPHTPSDAIVRVLNWVEENQLELIKDLHLMEARALQRYQTVAASNPNTPISYLRQFSKSENETTIFWLGENPSPLEDVIKVFVDNLLSSDEHEKCHLWGLIANNISLGEDTIELLSKHKLYWV